MAVVHVIQHTDRIVQWTEVVRPDTPIEPTDPEKTQTIDPQPEN